jgi:hypothetical protein
MNKIMYFQASITVFVLLMLGMSIGLYLFGFSSPFVSEFSDSSVTDPATTAGDFLNEMSQAIISAFTEHIEVTLPMIGFGLLAGFTGGSYAGGSVIKFLIMIMLLFVVVNIFFFPVVPTIQSHMTSGGFNPLITILSVIFNAMLFLTVFTFVSGED